MSNTEKKTSVKVVKNLHCQWRVEKLDGTEVVPYGKYSWISEFDETLGLARVNITNLLDVIKSKQNGDNKLDIEDIEKRWGIINEEGVEVLPVEYNEIWKFEGKNRDFTRTIKDGIVKEVYFSDLIPSLPAYQHTSYARNNDWQEVSYSEYEGSYAHDVMGYSDEDINDAFDGDPDAYWNID